MLPFIREAGLERLSSSDLLSGKRVAVEGNFLLRKFLEPLEEEEPFCIALGGIPRTMATKIAAAVHGLMSMTSISKMIFVFPGLSLQNAPMLQRAGSLDSNADAWIKQDKKAFTESCRHFFRDPRFMMTIISLLQSLPHVECIMAPYKPWAQLGYLAKIDEVDLVLGSAANLLYGNGKVRLMTDLDVSSGSFSWVDGGLILERLGVNEFQLMQAAVLAGLDVHQEAFEGRADDFARSLTQVRQGLVSPLSPTMVALRHMCVLYQSCRVEPLHVNSAPVDLYSIFGPRLPDFCFFFFSEGAISPTLLDTLMGGRLRDAAPRLDSGQYRLLLNALIPLRSRTLGMLAEGLHPFFTRQRILMVRYYDPDNEYGLKLNFGSGLRHYRLAVIEDGESARKMPISIESVLKSDLDAAMGRPNHRSVLKGKLRNESEVLFQVIAEGMRVLGYSDSESVASGFSESSVIVLQLLRLGMLNGESLNLKPEMDAAMTSHDEAVLFLSRLCCALHAPSMDKRAWRGKVDVDLTAFNCLLETMVRTLRNLLDAIAMRLWLDRLVDAPVHVISKVAQRLPFFLEHNVAVGLLMKEILKNPKGYLPVHAQADFPNLQDPVSDAKRAMLFFERIYPLLCKTELRSPVLDQAKQLMDRVGQESPFFSQ